MSFSLSLRERFFFLSGRGQGSGRTDRLLREKFPQPGGLRGGSIENWEAHLYRVFITISDRKWAWPILKVKISTESYHSGLQVP